LVKEYMKDGMQYHIALKKAFSIVDAPVVKSECTACNLNFSDNDNLFYHMTAEKVDKLCQKHEEEYKKYIGGIKNENWINKN